MTEPTSRPRGRPPAGGPTPLRNIRVPDDIWTTAKAIAQRRGETLTEVITAALQRYIARHRGD